MRKHQQQAEKLQNNYHNVWQAVTSHCPLSVSSQETRGYFFIYFSVEKQLFLQNIVVFL